MILSGLQVDWRRREDGWWGSVVFVLYPRVPGGFACEWIPASALRPLRSRRAREGPPCARATGACRHAAVLAPPRARGGNEHVGLRE